MVDLGFLLITFFVITAELSKPTMANLVMPKDGVSMPVGESKVMTILTNNDNRLKYYEGSWSEALRTESIRDIEGNSLLILRGIIQDKKKRIRLASHSEGTLTILIKPGTESNYRTLLDVLDELVINDIGTYAIVNQTPDETAWLKGRK